jgi:hypothetical protein
MTGIFYNGSISILSQEYLLSFFSQIRIKISGTITANYLICSTFDGMIDKKHKD